MGRRSRALTASTSYSSALVEPQQPASSQRPLRIAVLLDGWEQPRWIRETLEQIAARRLGEISAVVLNSAASASHDRSLGKRVASWLRNATYLPYELYSRFDRRFYRCDPDPFVAVDLQDLLRAAQVFEVTPRQTAFSDYFPDDVVDQLRARNLDVALRFGFRILRGKALNIASKGVWSFHHGDNRESRGGPTCFWEVFEGRETAGAVLQVLTEDLDAGSVIARVEVPTHALSVNQTAGRLYWRAIPALMSALDQVRADAPPAAQHMGDDAWMAYSRPLHSRPRAASTLRLLGRLLARRIRATWQATNGREQWRLLVHLDTASQSDVPNATPFRFRHLVPPPDRYWADPCPVWHDGRHWVFFEEHPFASPNAHISVVEVDAKGAPAGAASVALRRNYHLSYPFVFNWNGTLYMTPESYTRGAVELFRCVRFPDGWEFAGNLLEGVAAVDPTIARVGDRWWLFVATLSGSGAAADTLRLYFADTPLGSWTAHALNPVKVDLRSARPAGRLFEVDGVWYRPAQDGAPSYGSRIVVNRIEELSPTTYRETVVDRLTPSWDSHVAGVHTINCARGLTAIDARYRLSARHVGRR